MIPNSTASTVSTAKTKAIGFGAQLGAVYDAMSTAVEFNMNKVGIKTRDDQGAVSTEMAVLIAGMVAVAVAALVIFIARARSNAENIPQTVNPPT